MKYNDKNYEFEYSENIKSIKNAQIQEVENLLSPFRIKLGTYPNSEIDLSFSGTEFDVSREERCQPILSFLKKELADTGLFFWYENEYNRFYLKCSDERLVLRHYECKEGFYITTGPTEATVDRAWEAARAKHPLK